jgi:hypothetical protein
MCDAKKCRKCAFVDSCGAVVKPPCYVPKVEEMTPYIPWIQPTPWYPNWPWYNPPWYTGSSIVWTSGLAGNTGTLGGCTCGDAPQVAQKGTPTV